MNTQLALILADITVSGGGSGIGQALILLVAGVIVLGFLWWLNQNYVPEPMRKFGVLVIVLICVIVLLNFVLGLGGRAFIRW